MKNILKKIYFLLVNLIPVKCFRHFLRDAYNNYFELHFVPEEAVRKKFAFLKQDYSTVALGSSHCQSMFDPEEIDSSFNFGLNSADAFIFLEMYKNILRQSKVKNIIVFYDVFTKGSDNSKRKGFEYTFLPLKYILGINYEYDNKRIKNIVKNYEKNFIEKDENYKGFSPFEISIVPEYTIEGRCKSHLKIWNLAKGDNLIVDLANECFSDNRNFILVISPATLRYKSYMPDSKYLFGEIIEKLQNIENFNKYGKIYNFYDTNEFDDNNLWIDADHTNRKGAKFLTKLLKQKIQQDSKKDKK